jgi:hypothetical protein
MGMRAWLALVAWIIGTSVVLTTVLVVLFGDAEQPRQCYSAPLPSSRPPVIQGPDGPMLCTSFDTPSGSVLECRYLKRGACLGPASR